MVGTTYELKTSGKDGIAIQRCSNRWREWGWLVPAIAGSMLMLSGRKKRWDTLK